MYHRGNITFVSFLIHGPEDTIPPLKRLEWLLHILRADLQLVLYVCPFYRALFGPTPAALSNRLILQSFDFTTMETFQKARAAKPAPHLPEDRCAAKDTEFFLTLMNTKTELVARAVADGLVATPFVAFLDASIAKVLAQPTQALANLRNLTLKDELNVVLIPGGAEPTEQRLAALWNRLSWVFYGGFFVLPTARVKEWFGACWRVFEEYVHSGHLTWEVNIWADVAMRVPGLCQWYKTESNGGMLTLPKEWVKIEPGVALEWKVPIDAHYGC